MKYTRTSGDAAKCPDIPDQTIDVKESTSDGGTADAGANCQTTTDTSACTATSECTTKTSGFTTTSKFTIDSKNLKGSSYNKTVKDSDGSVLSECGYDFTYTKQ